MAIGGGGWGLHDILEAYSNKQMQYVILWDYDDDTEQWLRNQTMALFTLALGHITLNRIETGLKWQCKRGLWLVCILYTA